MVVTTGASVLIAGTDASCLIDRVPQRSWFGGLNRQFLRGPTGDIGEHIRMAAIAKAANDSSAFFGLPATLAGFQEDPPCLVLSPPKRPSSEI